MLIYIKPTTYKLHLGPRRSIGLGWSTSKTDLKIEDPKVPNMVILEVWLMEEKANGNISGTKTPIQWLFLHTIRYTGARGTSLRSSLHMC